MSEAQAEYSTTDAGHSRRVAVGRIVAVRAVDWGLVQEQTVASDPALTIVRGRVYGQIVVCNDDWLTIAPQVFDDGGIRNAVSLPWVTVTEVVVLE
jgi:hypothetical protein